MKLRIILIFLSLALWSCGSLRTAGYRPQGTFSTAQEYMSSAEVRRNSRGGNKGPFQLLWPVRKKKINRGYRPSSDPDHYGVDLGGWKGKDILAAHDGTVVYAGSGFRGYGKMILLEYDGNWATLYAHLNSFNVSTGQRVIAGQKIGGMGRTGRASGVHLHFELLKKKQPQDPLPYLRGDALVVDLK